MTEKTSSSEAFEAAVQSVNDALRDNNGSLSKAEIIRALDLDQETHVRVRNHFDLEHC